MSPAQGQNPHHLAPVSCQLYLVTECLDILLDISSVSVFFQDDINTRIIPLLNVGGHHLIC